MKTIPFLFAVLFINISLFAQPPVSEKTNPVSGRNNTYSKSGLGLELFTYISPSLEIARDYSITLGGTAIGSQGSLGFEGQLTYYRSISPKVKLGIGIVGGVYSFNILLHVTKDFLYLEKDEDYNINITEYIMSYGGLKFDVRHLIPVNKKNALELRAGVSGLFFLPWNIGVSTGSYLSNNQRKEIFRAEMDVNAKNKILFAPNLGFSYIRNIGENISLNASFLISYADRYIVESVTPFQIFGDNETLTGTFKKRFMYMGLGIGASYNF